MTIFRNSLFALLILSGTTFGPGAPRSSSAQLEENIEIKERLVITFQGEMDVELNDKTVLCTSADYSGNMLKVNIPRLREYTSLDHTNRGTGLPCIEGGFCTESNSPESIIKLGPLVTAPIRVQRKLFATIDHEKKTCVQEVVEIVDVDIKGKNFHHEAYGFIGNESYQVCVAL
jgi:hypothetical protein